MNGECAWARDCIEMGEYMLLSELTSTNNIDRENFILFMNDMEMEYDDSGADIVLDVDSPTRLLTQYKVWTNELAAKGLGPLDVERRIDDRKRARKQRALSSMLITSGFSFDGYRVTRYSGYISGDDVIQVNRGTSFLSIGATDTGAELSKALVKLRRNALAELREAAYALGCNAVIGVDFDYITLEPETANIRGGTTYLPYVFCVTANGNAVVIEKIDE
jgi:uncharacterized protein YbjQ (UPF0145 family)